MARSNNPHALRLCLRPGFTIHQQPVDQSGAAEASASGSAGNSAADRESSTGSAVSIALSSLGGDVDDARQNVGAGAPARPVDVGRPTLVASPTSRLPRLDEDDELGFRQQQPLDTDINIDVGGAGGGSSSAGCDTARGGVAAVTGSASSNVLLPSGQQSQQVSVVPPEAESSPSHSPPLHRGAGVRGSLFGTLDNENAPLNLRPQLQQEQQQAATHGHLGASTQGGDNLGAAAMQVARDSASTCNSFFNGTGIPRMALTEPSTPAEVDIDDADVPVHVSARADDDQVMRDGMTSDEDSDDEDTEGSEDSEDAFDAAAAMEIWDTKPIVLSSPHHVHHHRISPPGQHLMTPSPLSASFQPPQTRVRQQDAFTRAPLTAPVVDTVGGIGDAGQLLPRAFDVGTKPSSSQAAIGQVGGSTGVAVAPDALPTSSTTRISSSGNDSGTSGTAAGAATVAAEGSKPTIGLQLSASEGRGIGLRQATGTPGAAAYRYAASDPNSTAQPLAAAPSPAALLHRYMSDPGPSTTGLTMGATAAIIDNTMGIHSSGDTGYIGAAVTNYSPGLGDGPGRSRARGGGALAVDLGGDMIDIVEDETEERISGTGARDRTVAAATFAGPSLSQAAPAVDIIKVPNNVNGTRTGTQVISATGQLYKPHYIFYDDTYAPPLPSRAYPMPAAPALVPVSDPQPAHHRDGGQPVPEPTAQASNPIVPAATASAGLGGTPMAIDEQGAGRGAAAGARAGILGSLHHGRQHLSLHSVGSIAGGSAAARNYSGHLQQAHRRNSVPSKHRGLSAPAAAAAAWSPDAAVTSSNITIAQQGMPSGSGSSSKSSSPSSVSPTSRTAIHVSSGPGSISMPGYRSRDVEPRPGRMEAADRPAHADTPPTSSTAVDGTGSLRPAAAGTSGGTGRGAQVQSSVRRTSGSAPTTFGQRLKSFFSIGSGSSRSASEES